MLKAIDTCYKGYRFRSRLEARWAVFFDELGVRYEYERQGFELGMRPYNPEGPWSLQRFEEQQRSYGVMRYLPDFWLPDYQAWVEIKPEVSGPFDADRKWREQEPLWRLVVATGHKGVLYHGEPLQELHGVKVVFYEPRWGRGFAPGHAWAEEGAAWRYCLECGRLVLPICAGDKTPCCGSMKMRVYTWGNTIDAAQVARRARFEHGETGR